MQQHDFGWKLNTLSVVYAPYRTVFDGDFIYHTKMGLRNWRQFTGTLALSGLVDFSGFKEEIKKESCMW